MENMEVDKSTELLTLEIKMAKDRVIRLKGELSRAEKVLHKYKHSSFYSKAKARAQQLGFIK